MSLVIENVSKQYKGYNSKKFYALNSINLTMTSGTCLALIGQNGAGKTTLIKSILGLIQFEGSITIDDGKISEIIGKNQLGYMPEIVENLGSITGREYIESLMALRGIKPVEYKEELNKLTKRLAVEKYLDIPLEHCSKGNYKKILFIQAILHQPGLLVLDEPTDGLDPISRRTMLEIINEYKDRGCYVIVTTHLLSDIERIADLVAIINEGTVLKTVEKTKLSDSIEDWYIKLLQDYGEKYD